MLPYGLLGEKLGHSFSPQIHARFGKYEYRLFEKPKESLDTFLRRSDFAGLNVTIPYKKTVLPYCTSLSALAERIGSVNTIKVCADGLHGYNTDYFGFCRMLTEAGISISGERCVILGAGGSSSMVRIALQDLGAREITVVSHSENTPERIASLADYEIVINTTPVGMYPNNGKAPVDLRQFKDLHGVADLIFNPLKTALLLQAEELKVPCTGGLVMLVAQAKQASEIFQDIKIDDRQIGSVTKEIRQQCENILLIGMPGSGKSEIGEKLAKKIGKTFLDTDQIIEERAGKSIPQIFDEDGENTFRHLETQVLAEATARSGYVIATGGGIIKRQENLPLLRQNGRVIFIERPTQLLARKNRPLSSSNEAVEQLYKERLPLYISAANLRFCNNRTIAQAVNGIAKLLKEDD